MARIEMSEEQISERGSSLESSMNPKEALAEAKRLMLSQKSSATEYTFGCFCLFVGLAKQFRLQGKVVAASEYEAYADEAYERLPEGARW